MLDGKVGCGRAAAQWLTVLLVTGDSSWQVPPPRLSGLLGGAALSAQFVEVYPPLSPPQFTSLGANTENTSLLKTSALYIEVVVAIFKL